jgi:hypothetical protein
VRIATFLPRPGNAGPISTLTYVAERTSIYSRIERPTVCQQDLVGRVRLAAQGFSNGRTERSSLRRGTATDTLID